MMKKFKEKMYKVESEKEVLENDTI